MTWSQINIEQMRVLRTLNMAATIISKVTIGLVQFELKKVGKILTSVIFFTKTDQRQPDKTHEV